MSRLRYEKDQKYVAFDFETEHLNLYSTRPWELAYVVFTQHEIIHKRKFFIWWEDLRVTETAARMTGFDHDVYKREAQPQAEVFKHFGKILAREDLHFVTCNGFGFDNYVWQTWRRANKLLPEWSFCDRSHDISCLMKGIIKGMLPTDNYLCWNIRMSNYVEKGLKSGIKGCMNHYNMRYDSTQHHQALYDVMVTKDIFLKQMWDAKL